MDLRRLARPDDLALRVEARLLAVRLAEMAQAFDQVGAATTGAYLAGIAKAACEATDPDRGSERLRDYLRQTVTEFEALGKMAQTQREAQRG